MRAVDASRLVDEQWVSRGILQFPFLPVVDGDFLPQRPDLMLEHRDFKRCPILIGSNRNEGSWFVVYELSDRLTEAIFFVIYLFILGRLGSRVVSVLDAGAEAPGFKSQSRRSCVTVLGKLFTSIVPLFTK